MDTVHVGVYDTMADWEVGYATAHINNGAWQRRPNRYRTMTVGETARAVSTMGGLRVTPDLCLDDLQPEDSAMLVLPGAERWLEGGNVAFTGKAAQFLDAGVPVAAICGATAGLATAGLLDDRRHTSNAPEVLTATGYHGARHYRDVPAVTDGALITASGTAPVEFAREVFARLDLYDPAVLASWYKLYGLQDPSGYVELMTSAAG